MSAPRPSYWKRAREWAHFCCCWRRPASPCCPWGSTRRTAVWWPSSAHPSAWTSHLRSPRTSASAGCVIASCAPCGICCPGHCGAFTAQKRKGTDFARKPRPYADHQRKLWAWIGTAQRRGQLRPRLTTSQLCESVAVSGFDSSNLIRCQVGLQGGIRIPAILHLKGFVIHQPRNDSVNLFRSDGNHLPVLANTSHFHPMGRFSISQA